jgi:hypothetical protein
LLLLLLLLLLIELLLLLLLLHRPHLQLHNSHSLSQILLLRRKKPRPLLPHPVFAIEEGKQADGEGNGAGRDSGTGVPVIGELAVVVVLVNVNWSFDSITIAHKKTYRTPVKHHHSAPKREEETTKQDARFSCLQSSNLTRRLPRVP